MALFSTLNDFFALDIGTTAMRVVQLRGAGNQRSLAHYGSLAIDAKLSQSDSVNHQKQLLEQLKKLLKDTGVSTKNVVVGIPSNRMFTTVADFPKLSPKELDKTILYQADQFIPTKPDDSKIDYAVIGDSPTDNTKVEVLLASVAKKYAETRLDVLESIGLNVLAMEPDTHALSRAVLSPDIQEAVMILDMGASATDLVVVYGGNPRLVRSIPVGGDTLLKAAQQNLSVDDKQAMQFIYKFGLMQDKLEGQVFKAISPSIDSLISEIEKSIKFFTARYKNVPISKIIVTGRASVLPDFPVYLVNKTNITVEIGNSWLNVSYPKNLYNDLMAVSNQYSVAVGLAEREV
jgi:type IV pilus assembly protein PilM